MSLRFIGQPNQGIGGIPARDLTDAEVRALRYTQAELIGSGLYEKVADEPKRKADEAAAEGQDQ